MNPGIPFAAEIRHLRYLARKAAADYAADPGPHTWPTDAEKRTAVRAILAGRITQREVADILGVHTNTVGGWVAAARRKGEAS